MLSMEDIWVKAGRSLSAKYNLKDRKAKQVWYDFLLMRFSNLRNFIQTFAQHEWCNSVVLLPMLG